MPEPRTLSEQLRADVETLREFHREFYPFDAEAMASTLERAAKLAELVDRWREAVKAYEDRRGSDPLWNQREAAEAALWAFNGGSDV